MPLKMLKLTLSNFNTKTLTPFSVFRDDSTPSPKPGFRDSHISLPAFILSLPDFLSAGKSKTRNRS